MKLKEIEKDIDEREGRPACYCGYEEILIKKLHHLKSAIEKVLKWRALDGDGISDPLREDLYKLLKDL